MLVHQLIDEIVVLSDVQLIEDDIEHTFEEVALIIVVVPHLDEVDDEVEVDYLIDVLDVLDRVINDELDIADDIMFELDDDELELLDAMFLIQTVEVIDELENVVVSLENVVGILDDEDDEVIIDDELDDVDEVEIDDDIAEVVVNEMDTLLHIIDDEEDDDDD